MFTLFKYLSPEIQRLVIEFALLGSPSMYTRLCLTDKVIRQWCCELLQVVHHDRVSRGLALTHSEQLHGLQVRYNRLCAKEKERMFYGKREGLHELWSKNGMKIVECPYKDGKIDGELTCWYDNGVLREIVHYRRGIKHGREFVWRQDGTLAHICNYQDSDLEGVYQTYHLSGRIERQMTSFHRNQKHGEERIYLDEEGSPVLCVHKYENGKLIEVWCNPDVETYANTR